MLWHSKLPTALRDGKNTDLSSWSLGDINGKECALGCQSFQPQKQLLPRGSHSVRAQTAVHRQLFIKINFQTATLKQKSNHEPVAHAAV